MFFLQLLRPGIKIEPPWKICITPKKVWTVKKLSVSKQVNNFYWKWKMTKKLKKEALISTKTEWIQWSINILVISVRTFYGLEYSENLINLLSKCQDKLYNPNVMSKGVRFAKENRAVIMISIFRKRSSIQ